MRGQYNDTSKNKGHKFHKYGIKWGEPTDVFQEVTYPVNVEASRNLSLSPAQRPLKWRQNIAQISQFDETEGGGP